MNVMGVVLLAALSVARVEKAPRNPNFQQIRVSTGERMPCCEVGETMTLKVDVVGTNGQRVVGVPLSWKRRGDDGRTEEGALVSAADPIEVSLAMDRPGQIRFDFTAVETNAVLVTKGFSGGVMVAPEKIRASPPPADLDAFWTKQREALAKVPMRVLEQKAVLSNATWCVWDMKIACAGKRPVSGFLTVPLKAAKPHSLPIGVYFYGYSVGGAEYHFNPKAITFGVNAHGIENRREEAYYAELANGELVNYGLGFVEKPEDSYFLGMALRAMRAVEYMKSRPEWDGRTLLVSGHSQGGFQALLAASFDPDVTRAEANEPWMCDVSAAQRGCLPGFDPAYSPALGYFDPANLIGKSHAKVDLIAGLCDDTCPAGRIAAVRNADPSRCRITFYQGKSHYGEMKWAPAFTLE